MPSIGAIFDLSGSQAVLDESAAKGMQLASVQSWGQMAAAPKLAVEDGGSESFTRKEAASTLAAQKVPVVAGFTDNDAVLQALPPLAKAGIPLVSVGATGPELQGKAGNRVFLVAFSDSAQAAVAAEFARKNFGGEATILFDASSDYARNLRRFFSTRFGQLGGKVLLETPVTSGSAASVAGRIRRLPQTPSFIYLAVPPANSGRIVAALRRAGLKQPVLGGDGLDSQALFSSGPVDDVWFTTHALLDPQTGSPEARAFYNAYFAHHKVPPENAFAALGYDTYRLLERVMRTASTPEAIVAGLENTRNFRGVTGRISYGPGQRIPVKSVTVVKVANSQRTLAGSYLPGELAAQGTR